MHVVETITIYSENRMKHVNTLWPKWSFLFGKTGGTYVVPLWFKGLISLFPLKFFPSLKFYYSLLVFYTSL